MQQDLGAILSDDGRCRFRVWSPQSERVHLHIIAPKESLVCMEPKHLGYHTAIVEGIQAGTRYRYRLSNDKDFPDRGIGVTTACIPSPSRTHTAAPGA